MIKEQRSSMLRREFSKASSKKKNKKKKERKKRNMETVKKTPDFKQSILRSIHEEHIKTP